LVLFLVDEVQKIVGSLTDGDIRRALLKGLSLNDRADLAMNRDFRFVESDVEVSLMKKLREEDLKIIPVVDKHGKMIDLVNFRLAKSRLPIDAVIMAGGKGTRLHPYTKDMPKPMLELDGKPIIAHILIV
jgi:CBS domain-containing protein